MKDHMDKIVDECLTGLLAGDTSVEQCLARYPDKAHVLRPVLETAVQVRGAGRPEMRPLARRAGEQRMLAAGAQKGRRAPVGDSRAGGIVHRLLSRAKTVGPRLGQRPAPRLVKATLVVAVILLCILAAGLYQQARHLAIQRTGLLTDVVGVVEYRDRADGVWRVAASGLAFGSGWHVRTGALAAATLSFFDGSVTILGADTDVLVEDLSSRIGGGATSVILSQQLGETRNEVRPLRDVGSRFEITTPSAVASVHGTVFTVGVAADGTTTVSVTEGSVGVARDGDLQWLGAGQLTSVSPRAAPDPAHPEHPAAPSKGEKETKEKPKQSASNGTPSSTSVPKGPGNGQGEGNTGRKPVHPSNPQHPNLPRNPKHPEHPDHPKHPEHPKKQD